MTGSDRRTILKAGGASVFGFTAVGLTAGESPTDQRLSLLEASIQFEFPAVSDLEVVHRDRPVPYAIDPTNQTIQPLAVDNSQRELLESADTVVNFRGLAKDVDSLGGGRTTALNQAATDHAATEQYVTATTGYDIPELRIDWTANDPVSVLSGEAIEATERDGQFTRYELTTQSVEVRRRIVREELVDDEDLPEWKRSRVIDRPTEPVSVTPSLLVNVISDLKLVDG